MKSEKERGDQTPDPQTNASMKTTPAPPPMDSIRLNRKIVNEICTMYKGPSAQGAKASSRRSSVSAKPLKAAQSGTRPPPMLNLESISRFVGCSVESQTNKATVMVLGNFSAGKSTFINWFVREFIQRTGMAMETSGITIVAAGRAVTELKGEIALKSLRPQLYNILINLPTPHDDTTSGPDGNDTPAPSIFDYVSIKTCPSKDGKLHLIDLIDTPGLSDSSTNQLPFDFETVIFQLRNYVDLFLIFLDPITQATEKKMMSLVRRLSNACPDKLRFCLSKIDEVFSEEDRIKVMCQTTQALSNYLNPRAGFAFDLIPFHIPGAKQNKYLSEDNSPTANGQNKVINRIKDLVADIETVVEQKVQQSLTTLKGDLERLIKQVEDKIAYEQDLRSRAKVIGKKKRQRRIYRVGILILGMMLCCLQLIAQPDLLPPIANLINQLKSPDDASYSLSTAPNPTLLDIVIRRASRIDVLTFRIIWTLLLIALIPSLNIFKSPSRVDQMATSEEVNLLAESREFLRCARGRWSQLHRMYLDHVLKDDSQEETASSRGAASSSQQ